MVWQKIFLASLLGFAKADIPVHCLRSQVAGTWDFKLTEPSLDRSSCGHAKPDLPSKQPDVQALLDNKTAESLTVELSEPHKVHKGGQEVGSWTMIYDEGFEVRVGNDMRFFAFSKFKAKDGYDKPLEAQDVDKTIHQCGKTQVGWYHNSANKTYGCYVGVRRTKTLLEQKKVNLLELNAEVAEDMQAREERNMNMKVTKEWLESQADAINRRSWSSWRAKSYADKWGGLSYADFNKRGGIMRKESVSSWRDHHLVLLQDETTLRSSGCATEGEIANSTRSRVKNTGKQTVLGNLMGANGVRDELAPCVLNFLAKKQMQESEELKQVARDFPQEFDWRKVNGTDWMEGTTDQADCGSCYVVSSVRMFNARHKIAEKDPKAENFSISFPLHCSEYTQGCDGGYAFLISRWSSEVGLVPQKCMGYSTEKKCQDVDKRCVQESGGAWKVGDYNYIGGGYGYNGGVPTMRGIMKDLMEKGPMVVSFEPAAEFMQYGGGIFYSGAMKPEEWIKVDHAVLLVGWGEEMGEKYWIIQNSWGKDWGEDGYFRIARGINDSAVESIAVSATVVPNPDHSTATSFVASLDNEKIHSQVV